MIDFKQPEIVDIELLQPNEYNPNRMPKKEMDLLKDCISRFGFLFPIICNKEGDKYRIIDGYHRYETLKRMESKEVLILDLGVDYHEAVQLTVLMNRIKGMHKVDSMSDLVNILKDEGLEESEICKNLGMEAEEFHKLLAQIGIAEVFKDHIYSNSWTVK